MSDNIFEINDLSNIKVVDYGETQIYYMDNFYKYPDKVHDYVTSITPALWKSREKNSYNGIYFEDRRHYIKDKRMGEVSQRLSEMIKKVPLHPNTLVTNFSRFVENEFNDYKNNFWWPHIDDGPNAIIYLNKDIPEEHDGTSIYIKKNEYKIEGTEHNNPWQKKENWEKIIDIRASYNRLAIFDGSYYHAMNISDKRFFGKTLDDAKFRINQVIFFD